MTAPAVAVVTTQNLELLRTWKNQVLGPGVAFSRVLEQEQFRYRSVKRGQRDKRCQLNALPGCGVDQCGGLTDSSGKLPPHREVHQTHAQKL